MVRFVSTESGLRLLRTTLRFHGDHARSVGTKRGRVHTTSQGTSDPEALALQAGFLRLVSVTEATLDSLGRELTASSVGNVDQVIRALMLEKELAATSNWEARKRAFKRHHRVDIAKCAEHPRVEGAVEVRNAIAHGLGQLTTRQSESKETPKRLARIQVEVVNGRVDLRLSHLTECGSYAAEFLISVDDSVG